MSGKQHIPTSTVSAGSRYSLSGLELELWVHIGRVIADFNQLLPLNIITSWLGPERVISERILRCFGYIEDYPSVLD